MQGAASGVPMGATNPGQDKAFHHLLLLMPDHLPLIAMSYLKLEPYASSGKVFRQEID